MPKTSAAICDITSRNALAQLRTRRHHWALPSSLNNTWAPEMLEWVVAIGNHSETTPTFFGFWLGQSISAATFHQTILQGRCFDTIAAIAV